MSTSVGMLPPRVAGVAPAGGRGQAIGAIVVVVVIVALCILSGQAGILRVAFPALSMALGAFLLWRSKPYYVGFVFWLWFLTPFIGRMADFQAGWTPANAVELAPYAVTGLAGIPLLANLQCLTERRSVPYVCALVAIVYGAVFGLLSLPLFNVLRALLNWVMPVIFGLFVYQNRRFYPEFRKAIEKSFLYGVLILGIYAIYQFFVLPEWDRAWMLNVQLNSFGEIEPMRTRVFSTMNAPAIFAAVMAAGLLLLFNMKEKLRLLAAACGFIALMMTLSRASWLSLIAGVAYLMLKGTMKARVRFGFGVLACVGVLLVAAQVPGVDDAISQRMRTFSQPSQDVSYQARVEGHERALRVIAQEPWGEGIGSTDTLHNTEGDDDIIGPHDSTLLEFLYSLGWVGTLIYLMGLGYLFVQLARDRGCDSFSLSSRAIVLGFLAQALLNSVMLGVLGFMVWCFASMSLAEADYATTVSESTEPVLTRHTTQAVA